MPAWLLQMAARAVAVLRAGVGGGLVRGVGRQLPAAATGFGAAQLLDGDGGGGGILRRRRRKALTNTDLGTALTIASAISKKAAENFILMRVRRG